MRYIRLSRDFNYQNPAFIKSREVKRFFKVFSLLPVKVFTGLAIFIAIILYFIFAGDANFFFEKTGFDKTSGRTNVLLLGTGGEGHAGSNLSDTIILASVDIAKKDVALVSIPRDLWVNDLGAKINTAYAKGEEGKKGEGLDFAKKVVEKTTGTPVHYVVRIDFTGFVSAIDLLGGIDINVEKGFEDLKYPVAGREDDTCGLTITETEVDGVKEVQILTATGSAVLAPDPFTCRYEHIQFKAGLQYMDGTTALKFVRSRMGTNGAGSDFARSERQKQVILATIKKIFDLRNLFSPKKVGELFATFDKNIDTSFTQKEFSQIPTLLSQLNEFNFRSLPITSQGETPLLYNPPVSEFGAWVLLPKDNDWGNFARTIENFIYQDPTKRTKLPESVY